MIPFKKFYLKEAISGGHMDHPFDLPTVKSGNDLINLFNNIFQSIKAQLSHVKFDGINLSIKLVKEKNNYRFAVDRGTNKEIDIKGITADNVKERFPKEGHNMPSVITFVLTVLDSIISSSKKELTGLGFFQNKNLFFNTEYISGKTNVVEYEENMIVFHGINEFYYPDPDKPGRANKEVSYDENLLNSFIQKLKPIFLEKGFKVFGPTLAEISKEADINGVLNQKFTVKYDDKKIETKSLNEWLSQAVNPRKITVRDINNKLINAMLTANYKNILDGVPVVKIVGDNPEAQKAVIDGAVFYHATRVVGQEIKNSLTSEAGELIKHEGIVIRDPRISSRPLKLTGDFILGRLDSPFKK